MASLTWGGNSNAFITGFGGSVSSGDSCYVTDSSRDMAGSDQSAIDLLLLYIASTSAVNIGSASSPLQIVINQTATGLFEYRGFGTEVNLSAKLATNVIHRIVHRPAGGKTRLNLGAMDNAFCSVYGAPFEFGAETDIDKCYLEAGASGTLRGGGSVGNMGLVELVEATLRSERAISDIRIGLSGLLEFIQDGMTLPAVKMYGGRMVYKGGTIQDLELAGNAVLDCRGAWSAINLGTVTDGSIRIGPNVQILYDAIVPTVVDDNPVLKGGRPSVLQAA